EEADPRLFDRARPGLARRRAARGTGNRDVGRGARARRLVRARGVAARARAERSARDVALPLLDPLPVRVVPGDDLGCLVARPRLVMRARGLFRPCRIVYIRRFVRTERVFLRVAASSLLAVAAVGLGWGCAAPTVGIARGRELFQNCQPCHGDRGTGNVALRAPEIAGLPQWYVAAELDKFQKNVRGAHPDDNEGHRMRPMARTLYHPGDIESVAGYVASLPSVSVTPMMRGNVAAGQKQ